MIALVHNDSTYGAIKNIQDRMHESRYLDVELNNPDFLDSRVGLRRARPPALARPKSSALPSAGHSIAAARR